MRIEGEITTFVYKTEEVCKVIRNWAEFIRKESASPSPRVDSILAAARVIQSRAVGHLEEFYSDKDKS